MVINIFFKIIFFHTLSYTKITQNFKVIACFSMCDQCLTNKKIIHLHENSHALKVISITSNPNIKNVKYSA